MCMAEQSWKQGKTHASRDPGQGSRELPRVTGNQKNQKSESHCRHGSTQPRVHLIFHLRRWTQAMVAKAQQQPRQGRVLMGMTPDFINRRRRQSLGGDLLQDPDHSRPIRDIDRFVHGESWIVQGPEQDHEPKGRDG